MDISKPGVVSCRKSPESDAISFDLRRKIDGVLTSQEKVLRILTEHLHNLPPPLPNAEKIAQMYQSIRPYVPDEFRDDPMYAKPSEQQKKKRKNRKASTTYSTCSSGCCSQLKPRSARKRDHRRLREGT
eukprot:jgi/Phyca11/121503/e_gw1.44.375.1